MYLLGLGAVEAVAAVGSEVTYQVSWGIVPTIMSEPPKSVEAETTRQQPPLIETLTFKLGLILPWANQVASIFLDFLL